MSYAEGDMNSNNNNKPTYAQVAASPPLDDENDTNGGSEFGEHQQPGQKEKLVNVSAVGGAHFSKPTPKQEKGEQTNIVAKGDGKGSISSTGSSEPEMINVEPNPKPAAGGGEKPKGPPIVDNVEKDCAPLKRTTMLTVTKTGAGDQQRQTVHVAGVSDSDLEVVCDETEKKRRLRNRMLLVGGGLLAAALVGVVVWKYTRKPQPSYRPF